MIQSGLYNKLASDPSIQALLPSDSSVSPQISLAYKCIHFVRAPKQPTQKPQSGTTLINLIPYIVIHLPNTPPAEETLQGVTDLRDDEIQFDTYANDVNGALTARQLANAIRELFLPDGGPNFSGPLSDGTTITFYSVMADFDDNYEVGGVGFLFRSVLKVKAFVLEGPNTF